MTDQPDWARVDALLDETLEQPAERRRAWLESACGDDERLREKVRSLLVLAESEGDDLVAGGALRGPLWDELARELLPPASALAPGARLGPYEIRAELGAGGMGRVFRAYDPGLGREVALKLLDREFASDPTSLKRFEREARLLATLNHPNIAVIHGFQVLDGHPCQALELIEGRTLAERIAEGPLAPPEAASVARQIADALEEAHDHGIVHRDLKPSNVMLLAQGRVKVLDFGLARFVDSPGDAGEADVELTRSGVILGTAAYMSPEQARGEPVDERTDVWAFGCLLFEMLAGQPAFRGRTISDVLASVLRDELDFSPLPPRLPPGLRRILRRSLEKDRRRRLRHIADARLDLDEAEDPLSESLAPPHGTTPSARWWWLAGALVAVVLGVAALSWIRAPGAPDSGPARRFVLDLPAGTTLPADYPSPFAFSPDGRTLVLLARDAAQQGRLYRRAAGTLEWTVLPGTEGAAQPFFSPDGSQVAFFVEAQLKRVALDGSATAVITHVGNNPRGGAWGEHGTIVFAPTQTAALLRVSARGGEPRPFTRLDDSTEERSHRWPQVLPGGRNVLYTVLRGESDFDDADLAVASLETGEERIILANASHGLYAPGGHIVYGHAGQLRAVPFDLDRLAVTGPPAVVLEGVAYDPRNGATRAAVAADGTLAYVSGHPESAERRIVWVDETGKRSRVTEEARRFLDPRLSPDGRRVALRIGAPQASNVWTLDLATGTLTQVSFGLAAFRPTWTPDGARIVVATTDQNRFRLVSLPANGRGSPAVLLEAERRVYPCDWTPDGRYLIYQARGRDAGWDLHALEVDAAGRVRGSEIVVATAALESNARLAPDGSWLAYESDERDGLVEIYVRPFHGPSVKVKVSSAGGGRWPHWGPANELVYWASSAREMRRVTLRADGQGLVVRSDERLWAPSDDLPVFYAQGFSFDVEPRRGRFLMMETAATVATAEAARPILALDWVRELETLKPARSSPEPPPRAAAGP